MGRPEPRRRGPLLLVATAGVGDLRPKGDVSSQALLGPSGGVGGAAFGGPWAEPVAPPVVVGSVVSWFSFGPSAGQE